jgi:outer membrane protein assembly factor BamB
MELTLPVTLAVLGGALLHAANFSVGVHLFFRAARELARCFRGRPEFTVEIHEEHHQAKLEGLHEGVVAARANGVLAAFHVDAAGEATGKQTGTFLMKKQFTGTVMMLFIGIVIVCGLPRSGSADAPMFRANLNRTGVYPEGGPSAFNDLVWKFKTERQILSSPVVSDGVVYLGSNDRHLYAVDIKTGQQVWKFETEDIVEAPAAVSGGVVYFGGDGGHLYAVDSKTGQEQWRFKTAHAMIPSHVSSSPAISDGMVYFGSLDGHLYAVDINTRREKWKFKTEDWIFSSPALSDGTVVFGSLHGHLYAVDSKTGQEQWKFKTEGKISSSPAVSGGMVYFGSGDGHLYVVE